MLELCTGSRLHFGLMELAADQPHRFGGLGLMVEAPQLRVRVGQPARTPSWAGGQAEIDRRVHSALEHVQRKLGRELPRNWTVEVLEHPALHSGLGLGTQLAAAITTAVELATSACATLAEQPADAPPRWQPVAPLPPGCNSDRVRELSSLSGRGKRSAIGLHGFLYGGLVQDLGYSWPRAPAAALSPAHEARPIATRSVSFPSSWSVVLVLSTEEGEVHGAAEECLITAAAAEPNRNRQTMLELSDTCMVAAAKSDFDGFVTALDGYMKIAASLFEPVQAGRYRDEVIAHRVEVAGAAGLGGVGQSSWGPTVFGFAAERAQAEQAAERLRRVLGHHSVRVLITRAADHGARWRTSMSGVQHAG